MENEIVKKDLENLPASHVTNHYGEEKNINIQHLDKLENNQVTIIVRHEDSRGNHYDEEIHYRHDFYNLIVLHKGSELPDREFVYLKSAARFSDYTTDEIYDKNRRLTEKAISEIRSFPVLIAAENEKYWGEAGDKQMAIYGIMSYLEDTDSGYKIGFHELKRLKQQYINNIAFELGMGEPRALMPLNTTHWSIRKIDLAKVLNDAGLNVPVVS